jgi:DNA replication protein DnaC
MDQLDQIFPGWEPYCAPAPIRAPRSICTELLLNNFLASGVPTRYHLAHAKDFDIDLSPLVGKSVFMSGGPGSGKTHRAVVLQKEWMWKQVTDRRKWDHMKSCFVSVSELLMKLRMSFNDKTAPQEGELIQRLCNTPFLILDDLGTQQGTDYAFQVLYVIINERYNWERTTVITSNFGLKELHTDFSAAIASRLYEMCNVVELSGEDHRLK